MSFILGAALRADAVALAAAAEIGDQGLSIRVRGELGVRPTHETIYLVGKLRATVDTHQVERGREGTLAAQWPIGTPLALVADGADPAGEFTLHLAHPFSGTSYELDLQGCYRRLRIGSEVIHDGQLRGERGAGYTFRHDRVLRGQEGTTEAAHAAGATVTVLAPGEV